MRCCGSGHNHNNQRVKDWSSEEQTDQHKVSKTPLLAILGILIVGLIIYRVLF